MVQENKSSATNTLPPLNLVKQFSFGKALVNEKKKAIQ